MDSRFYKTAGPLSLGVLIAELAVDSPEGRVLDDQIIKVAPLAESQPGDLCFLESKSHLEALASAKATACFVSQDLAAHVGKAGIVPLISAYPKAHFGRAIERLFSETHEGAAVIDPSAHVHATAIIGPGVTIGARTRVGAYAVIEKADVGADCEIKAHAVIGGNGLGVSADEGGLLSLFHVGTVQIGDRVRIGSSTCVDRAMIGETILEDDVKLDNLVQVAHNCRIGARTIIASLSGISGSCDIGCDVKIAGQVGMADHLSVGDGATLLAKAGVMHNVPAGENWVGSPAQPVRQFMREVATVRKLSAPKKKG
jgi:UDP-3-O-[3-hydroxymyristoyl] glucosamine N-acyltransferase